MKYSIPLTCIDLDGNGLHILIDITLGKTKAHMIIDTGASKSVIDEFLLSNCSHNIIETESVESSQLTEMVAGKIISIDKIKIHKKKFTNFQALTMQLDHINSIYKRFVDKPIAGLLGGDFLAKYRAVINYNKKTITLILE